MRKVIGIGETVLDIILKNEKPVDAIPGGSVYNSMVSLGRAGLDTVFIGDSGNDRVGRKIKRFLDDNGTDTTCFMLRDGIKSALSLAFLNEKNDAEYVFYKNHDQDILEFRYPDIQPDDIVLFGSYYAVNPLIRRQMRDFLDYASRSGALLYYDVNFRPSHRNESVKLRAEFLENFEYADIVRGSTDDFEVMAGKTDADTIYKSEIAFYTKNFIFTQGAGEVVLKAEGGIDRRYGVEPTETVSTVGAGDNFNAGVIYGLVKHGVTRDDLKRGMGQQTWDSIVSCAMAFAANSCAGIYNYIDTDFAQRMKDALNG